jgi:hypothetical protein
VIQKNFLLDIASGHEDQQEGGSREQEPYEKNGLLVILRCRRIWVNRENFVLYT